MSNGFKPPRPLDLRAFPMSGMRDSLEPTVDDIRKALYLQNVYAPHPNSMLVGRPGIVYNLETEVAGEVQLEIQYTKLDGTEYAIVVAGGRVFRYTQASIIPIEITLPYTLRTTGLIYGVVFADRLILTDGVSKPVWWNGAGAFAELTACPVLYGQPEVYYAKLVGINAADRIQLVWSEEMNPFVGYLAANYENQWRLGQSGQSPLYAIKATNEALYFFRSHSIGAVTGPTEDAFQTDGTREAVSGSVGTKLPSSVVYRQGEIWFLDADGRAFVIPIGGHPKPLWEDYQETLKRVDRGRLNQVWPEGLMIEHPQLPLMLAVVPVLASTPGASGNRNLLILTYDTRTYEAAGIWQTPTNPRSMGVLKDAFGYPMLLQGNYYGQGYRHTLVSEAQWDDLLPERSAIEHKVIPNHIGWDEGQEKEFTDLTALFRGPQITAELTYETPYVTRTVPLPISVPSIGTGVLLGVFLLGTDILGSGGGDRELRRRVGLKAWGRWIRPAIRHQVALEPFRFFGFELAGYLIDNTPTIR